MNLTFIETIHNKTLVFIFLDKDLWDVVPHKDDLIVIFVVTMSRNVYRVLVD